MEKVNGGINTSGATRNKPLQNTRKFSSLLLNFESQILKFVFLVATEYF